MILFQNFVQVLHRSMAAAPAQDCLLFHTCNRRATKAALIGVDDPRLRIGSPRASRNRSSAAVASRSADEQEVDGGTGRIDGPV